MAEIENMQKEENTWARVEHQALGGRWVVGRAPWAPPWWCTPGSSASSQKVSMARASGLAPHSRVVPACGICSVDTWQRFSDTGTFS